MANNNIQFFGIEEVIDAYQARGVPSWALWIGNQFLFPCYTSSMEIGEAQLRTLLEKLEATNRPDCYKLKVYDDVKDGKIRDKTPSDGSFNFILSEYDEETDNYYKRKKGLISGAGDIAILKRLEAIEQKVSGVNETASVYDKIMDFAETDAGKMVVGHLLGAIFKTPGASNIMRGAISGINQGEAKEMSYQDAMIILKSADDRLEDHLIKLAKVAQANPMLFKTIISSLENM